MSTRYGEMLDMIACLSIYNGGAEEKDRMSFDEFSELNMTPLSAG